MSKNSTEKDENTTNSGTEESKLVNKTSEKGKRTLRKKVKTDFKKLAGHKLRGKKSDKT